MGGDKYFLDAISDLPNNFQVSDIVKELKKKVKLGNIVD